MAQNRNALDWGKQGLLAYGACTYVVIADVVNTMKRIQTLDGHSRPVTRVRWAREQLQFRNEGNYSLTLASGDEGGSILVWKVAEAAILASLNPDGHEKLGEVVDMEWHPDKPHLLASVHAPSSLVLWNIDTSSMLWRCDFGETLTGLNMNPFDKQHVCLSSNQGWIYFVRDFKEESKPLRVDVKYRINSGQPGTESGSKAAPSGDAFQHMLFSPHHRNIVYFVLERRILIFDLTIHQTVGSIGWDKTKPAFRTLLVSRHHEHMLFVLHDDGSLTTWRRRDADSQSFAYQASIDVVRISKQTRKRDRGVLVTGAVISPYTKLFVSLVSSDGVIWNVSYEGPTVPVDQNNTPPTLLICGEMECITSAISSISVWNNESIASTASDQDTIRAVAAGSLSVNSSAQYYLGTSLNSHSWQSSSQEQMTNVVAVGSHDGRLLLVDMVDNSILRMFSVQPGCALRGVRWISSTKIICFTTESIDKTLHRNRIKIIDLGSGQVSELRKKNEPEPTFIRGIRLSPSKTYLIVLLKDQPFQVWELKTCSLLRSLPFPHLTALEWNPSMPSVNVTSSAPSSPLTKTASQSASASLASFATATTSSSLGWAEPLASSTSLGGHVSLPPLTATSVQGSFSQSSLSFAGGLGAQVTKATREQFVFSNPDGTLHFFQVENNQVQALPGMKAEPGIGIVASIAWKDNILVAGDTNGTIVSHHLEKKKAHTFETGKGLVRRIRFGPATEGSTGYHNILVLFNDGDFGIWDLEYNVRVSISSYYKARDLKALDLDWWNSSQPIIATTDGAIRLVDRALSHGSNSPLLFSHISYPLNCPLLLPPRQALFLKTMLNHPLLVDGSVSSSSPTPTHSRLNSATSSAHLGLLAGMTNTASSGFDGDLLSSSSTLPASLASPATSSPPLVLHSDSSSPSPSLSFSLSSSLAGLVPDNILTDLARPGLSIAERGLLIANYFGNIAEQRFWTLVIHSFKHNRTPPVFKGGSLLGPAAYASQPQESNAATPSDSSSLPEQDQHQSILASSSNAVSPQTSTSGRPAPPNRAPSGAIDLFASSASQLMSSSQTIVIDAEPAPAKPQNGEGSLPVYFDLLLDPSQLRTLHMNGAALQEKKRAQNYQLTQSITDFHLTLGQKEKAMELLLETPPDNAMYYADVLKACVVAASLSPDTFRNTVKLVATSLIANGSVDEGVQLLSLIGKSLDACRYLQSHDRWIEAAQLAKLTLSYDDAGHIYKKWVEHLVSEGQLLEAIEIEITLGEYDIVLALLHKANLFELSALFVLAANEHNILTEEWLNSHPTDADTSPLASTPATLPALLESVFLDYGWYLHKIGCKAAASYFLSEKAGDAGKEAINNLNLGPHSSNASKNNSLTTLPQMIGVSIMSTEPVSPTATIQSSTSSPTSASLISFIESQSDSSSIPTDPIMP